QERAVEFLQNQVRNNPDNAALLDEVKEIFSNAAMAEEGAALVETSRQEGIEFMNRGVLLARDGSYEEAIASLREARQAMPANVRVLFNLAYVLITRMQKAGRAPELLSEAREALLAANSRQPGLARYVQLRATLDALAHGGKTEPVL
ncbi:MAG: response regulator receiver protein, partial [Rhodocyclaceae bacterium]|nr:response regulator receiver protein [Rhodocyclaceae bacterium]